MECTKSLPGMMGFDNIANCVKMVSITFHFGANSAILENRLIRITTDLEIFKSKGEIVKSWENKRRNPDNCLWTWLTKSELWIKAAGFRNSFFPHFSSSESQNLHLERLLSSRRSCGWPRSLVGWCIGTWWPPLLSPCPLHLALAPRPSTSIAPCYHLAITLLSPC